ncbi:hypothetical protein SNE40_016358 [Patella caerulea]|uniref:Uncharacterized protein n=1 Tax=Patella caerulea TaxID=87958 RepID=A0AAN8JDF3_PATCE
MRLNQLSKWRDDFSKTTTGKGQLIGRVLGEAIRTVKRQLLEMDYFKPSANEEDDIDERKLQFAPLTNLGCESEFAGLSNCIRTTGGSTPLASHSRKAIVKQNGLLTNSDFCEMSEDDRRKKWKWARSSEQARMARRLETEFLEKVKLSRQLAVQKKNESAGCV